MPLTTFNNVILKKIVKNILKKKCEIDPLTMRYQAIINLIEYFGNNEKKELIGKVLKENDKNKFEGGDYIDILNHYIDKSMDYLLTFEEIKDLYKLTQEEINKANLTVEYNWYNGYYKKEEVMRYLYINWGQEKLDSKRRISENKSKQMREMLKDKREKGEEQEKDRKERIYEILADAGLFWPRGLYEADYYVSGGGELTKEKILRILKQAKTIIDRDRQTEIRTENLMEMLEMYDCKDKKKDTICANYCRGSSSYTLEQVVDYIREIKWLETYADYTNILKSNIRLEKYDSLLGKYVTIREYDNIFNNYGDGVKTYAVELLLVKKGWDKELLGNVPPLIKKRIDEVIRQRGKNEEIMERLEKEREEKREEVRKREEKKKEDRKQKRREANAEKKKKVMKDA